jgi:hypothetical protein
MAAGFSWLAWQHHLRPARRHPRRMSGESAMAAQRLSMQPA